MINSMTLLKRFFEIYIPGLQITIQKLSDIMSDTNRILSDIYENLSDVKFSKNFQAQYNG